jgi:CspA family cold shock protein
VKLNSQRKATKKESKTRPKACNPYGPTSTRETAEFTMASLSPESFESTPEYASSQNVALNTIAIAPDLMPGGIVRSICALRSHKYSSHEHEELTMATGTVKWFNPTKGYGFIQPNDGGKDVFVHISAVERAGLSTLNEGQTLQYEVTSNRGKESAENLKVG